MNEMRMSKQHINNISRKINPANINSFDIKGLQSATVAMKYRRIQGMNYSFNNLTYRKTGIRSRPLIVAALK